MTLKVSPTVYAPRATKTNSTQTQLDRSVKRVNRTCLLSKVNWKTLGNKVSHLSEVRRQNTSLVVYTGTLNAFQQFKQILGGTSRTAPAAADRLLLALRPRIGRLFFPRQMRSANFIRLLTPGKKMTPFFIITRSTQLLWVFAQQSLIIMYVSKRKRQRKCKFWAARANSFCSLVHHKIDTKRGRAQILDLPLKTPKHWKRTVVKWLDGRQVTLPKKRLSIFPWLCRWSSHSPFYPKQTRAKKYLNYANVALI